MRPRLLLVHGWALDPGLWDRVLAALGADARAALLADAGYYGAPAARAGAEGPLLGVGQSLGALVLLAEPPPGLVGVVAIDGFARFGQAPDFPEGVPGRVLQRMKARLAEGALPEFLRRAGGSPPPGEPDLDRLADGLDRLYRLEGRRSALPVWRLHAEEDPIAPLSLADASFAGLDVRERRLRPGRGHLSPLQAPAACASLVRAALDALS